MERETDKEEEIMYCWRILFLNSVLGWNVLC